MPFPTGRILPDPVAESTLSAQETSLHLPDTVELSIGYTHDKRAFTGTALLNGAHGRGLSLPEPTYGIEETTEGLCLCPSMQLIESYLEAADDQAVAMHAENQSRRNAYKRSKKTVGSHNNPWRHAGRSGVRMTHATLSVEIWNKMQSQLDQPDRQVSSDLDHVPTLRSAAISITPQLLPTGSLYRSRWTLDSPNDRWELFAPDRDWSERSLISLHFQDEISQDATTARGPLITNDEIRDAVDRLQDNDRSFTQADGEFLNFELMNLRSAVLQARWPRSSAAEVTTSVKLSSGNEATLRCVIDPLHPRVTSDATA